MAPKIHTVRVTTVRVNGNNKVKEVSGDLQRLIEYFGYTLEVGHSWNPKINRNPKTIKGLISAVQKASDIQYGSTYIREIYELLN